MINTDDIVATLNMARGVARTEKFRQVDVKNQGHTLLELSTRVRKNILSLLTDDELVNLLNPLDPDEAADLLQELPQHCSKN